MIPKRVHFTKIIYKLLAASGSSCISFQVARELEEPWKYDPNEIPCGLLQHEFNERLLQVGEAARYGMPVFMVGLPL